MTRVGMMKRILGTAVLIAALAPVAQAETVRSKSFVGDIQRRAVTMQARDGSGSAQALQAYVSVTTVAGVVPGQAQIQAAGAFAAKAGCRDARALTTILAGVTAKAAEFEVLCRGGQ
ncbi:hypothetical protein [uncultured Mameliella sp.]|uniref:hypothetical protein n=1 Tax=uncultured Mameliella sp. TaxID=1447087 RepID=UPI00263871FA|nr:hypothetical protein [uncultured Mameliella sp.]